MIITFSPQYDQDPPPGYCCKNTKTKTKYTRRRGPEVPWTSSEIILKNDQRERKTSKK